MNSSMYSAYILWTRPPTMDGDGFVRNSDMNNLIESLIALGALLYLSKPGSGGVPSSL